MSGAGSKQLTPQQRLAIQTVDDNLLVSAAAGSGKTTVLAERCAYLLCDAAMPCSVDQLLVVTFTEAAAAQMKARIEAAIQNRLAKNPENESLRRQAAQIDLAQVSTLHGFCANLLRMHFHLLSLEPNFTILDQEEAALLRRETVAELFAGRYEDDASGDFQRLVDWYGDGNDAELQRHVLRAHALLCSLVEPDQWLTTAYDQLVEAANESLPKTALGHQLIALLKERIGWLSDRCARNIAVLEKVKGLEGTVGYIRLLQDEIQGWAGALGSGDLDSLGRRVAAFAAPRKPALAKTHSHKAIADSVIESIREEMGSQGALCSMAGFTMEQWQIGLRSLLPSAKVFLDLVGIFGERYQEAKHRTKGVDFADLERLALQLLRTKDASGHWIPSAVARQCHQRFAQVLVDEYQDINALQDEILRLVSRECLPEHKPLQPPNLFAVGDVKQSIYRFRLADPQRFLQRDERYRRKQGGQVIDLQQNFRSRAPLLEAINSVFEKLMTRQSAMIEYDQSHRLHPGAIFPAACDGTASFTGAPIELHLLHTQDGEQDPEDATMDRTEWEATLMARRIQELLGTGLHVAEDGAMRPIEYRDVVILLRSAIHKADQVAEVLSRHGIPVHADARDGFFASTEIQDMIALLQLLDNSQQDIPLAAFLRGPLAHLPEPENNLSRLRLAYPSGEQTVPFHQAVFRYAAEQTDELAAALRQILQRLARWRSIINRQPLADVIWSILDETGYLAFCSALDRGRQRAANLLAFHQRAREFGSFASQGLYRFLRFLHGIQESGDLGQPSMLGEGENAVRIMTVHQSKGLEFPVVFVPELGKGFNLQDMNSRVLLDRSGILGMPAVDERRQVRYPSLGTVLARQQMRQQIIAEELRVLYVAMTRAREHLILMGTCTSKEFDTWSTTLGDERGPLAAETVIGAKSPLQWIVQTQTALQREKIESFAVQRHSAESLAAWSADRQARPAFTPWQMDRARLKPLEPAPAVHPVAERIIERLKHLNDDRIFTNKRAVISVTEWAKGKMAPTLPPPGGEGSSPLAQPPPYPSPVRLGSPKSGVLGEGKEESGEVLSIPRCIAGETPLLAVDRGVATHLVLQHAVFVDGPPLRQQVRQMIERRLMMDEQADAVDYDSINWFLNSDVGKQLREAGADDVLREVPFALALDDGGDKGLDRTMLRGRIDLLLRDGKDWIVVDYKTDDVKPDKIPATAERYRPQVGLYRQAIQQLLHAQVSAVYLVFLHPRQLHRM
jgi:ATP-dependent helicase/nuclease subunit A